MVEIKSILKKYPWRRFQTHHKRVQFSDQQTQQTTIKKENPNN